MLTADRLRELLHHDPEMGKFIRRVRRGPVPTGALAGHRRRDGYLDIKVDGRLYLAHRLAFLYMTGHWPKYEADHCNLDKADNRWLNLREATRDQNNQNAGVRKNNWTGCKGVTLRRRPRLFPVWRVSVWADGKLFTRHCRGTLEEAAKVYASLARKHHGEFARVE
jgi:HNH endonuclease